MLELTLDPASAAGLMAVPGLRRAGRGHPVSLEWHDTPDGALLADGLVLTCTGKGWELAREKEPWVQAQVVAAARDRPGLGPNVPDTVQPRALWEGTRRSFHWSGQEGAATLLVLEGGFGRRGRPPPCRLLLDGPGGAVSALAGHLARAGAQLPTRSLAREAMLMPPAPVPAIVPEPAGPPGAALAGIIVSQLRQMQHWAGLVAERAGPEPVHQMRVATRRLRAALSTFRHAASGSALAEAGAALKDCAARLGAARDWDVFLAGAGARLAAAFPEDARCAAMLRSGARRRRLAYKALRTYLSGPTFRALLASLAAAAMLRPWAENPALTLEGFAGDRLSARWKQVRKDARRLADLPVPALHELRKDCKKLRYTAEFFSSLFPQKPGKRFVKTLAALQEELGLLNDGAAVAGLMAQLGRADRGYAAGLAEGFIAAGSTAARGRIVKAWKRLAATKPFWPKREKAVQPIEAA